MPGDKAVVVLGSGQYLMEQLLTPQAQFTGFVHSEHFIMGSSDAQELKYLFGQKPSSPLTAWGPAALSGHPTKPLEMPKECYGCGISWGSPWQRFCSGAFPNSGRKIQVPVDLRICQGSKDVQNHPKMGSVGFAGV